MCCTLHLHAFLWSHFHLVAAIEVHELCSAASACEDLHASLCYDWTESFGLCGPFDGDLCARPSSHFETAVPPIRFTDDHPMNILLSRVEQYQGGKQVPVLQMRRSVADSLATKVTHDSPALCTSWTPSLTQSVTCSQHMLT